MLSGVESSGKMASLLLVTGALLLIHCCSAVSSFSVRGATLSIEPSDVTTGTDVTLRCEVENPGGPIPELEYTIYMDSTAIHTMRSDQTALVYNLTKVQYNDSGWYACKVTSRGTGGISKVAELVVRGAPPQLHLSKDVVKEGEELTAQCTAPGETGPLYFYFYNNSNVISRMSSRTNQAEMNLTMVTSGNHTIHCSYSVLFEGRSHDSRESNKVTVLAEELDIRPVLVINPPGDIYEGDQLDLSCTVQTSLIFEKTVEVQLWHGKRLNHGNNSANHSMIIEEGGVRLFMCRLYIGQVRKEVKQNVTVQELFSAPTLTLSPAEVYQRDPMTLTCRSQNFSSARIQRENLNYSLVPAEVPMTQEGAGVFRGTAPLEPTEYTCVARVETIHKSSSALKISPKVHVSPPMISVVGRAVLGRPFRILCQSVVGSLPINYTLLKDSDPVDSFTVDLPNQQAVFTMTVSTPEEMQQFMCEAQNSHKPKTSSKKLDATLIVPLSQPTLTVIPVESEITEGDHLFLICGVRGSPPVTFKWYLVGKDEPVFNKTSDKNTAHYLIEDISTGYHGKYICEANNYANNVVRSTPVVINASMKLWKRALIWGCISLVVVALVIAVTVRHFMSKRANRAEVSVWSERPSTAVSMSESRPMTSEPDVEYTEVVHRRSAEPSRTPARMGTDTVYSELQTSTPGDVDLQAHGSVEYVELNSGSESVSHRRDANAVPGTPVPVD